MKGEGAHTVDMAIVRHRFCMNTGDFADMIRVYIYTNAEIENIIEIERVSPLGMFQQVGQASGAGGADKSNVAITWSSKRKSVFWGGGREWKPPASEAGKGATSQFEHGWLRPKIVAHYLLCYTTFTVWKNSIRIRVSLYHLKLEIWQIKW